MTTQYDCIVIGAGSGGLTVARGLTKAGKKVLLIEKGDIGGDCTNVGCVPSKAALSYARQHKNSGLSATLAYARLQREHIRQTESVAALSSEGIVCVQGSASFVDSHTVEVHDKKYSAKKIVIATGSRPVPFDVQGARQGSVISNEDFFELSGDVPHLVIVGGGYIGCELAEVAALSGTKVTIINRDSRLIPREEPESSERIHAHLTECGVTIFYNATLASVHESELSLSTVDGIVHTVHYTYILAALGRTPAVQSLNLDKAGVAVKRGIVTNAYCETSVPHILAIGDCVDGNPSFTHWANNEGRCVIRNVVFPWWKASYRHEPLPTTLYTEIEIARVGPTLDELLKEYSREEIITARFDSSHNDRISVTEAKSGFVILHALRSSGTILGGTIALTGAGDILPRLVQAVRSGEHVQSLSTQVFPYPTQADMLKRAADVLVLERLQHPQALLQAYLKTYGTQLLAITIWTSLVASFTYAKITNGLSTIEILREIVEFVSMHPLGPLVYIFCYAFRPLLFIPATLLTFASGVLFGLWNGLLLTVVAETASAMVGYSMARLVAGKAIVQSRIGVQIKDLLSTDLSINLLITRFAFLPFDAVNFVCGALKIPPLTFFWTTALGIIPGAFVFILAGTSIDTQAFLSDFSVEVNPEPLVIAGALLVLCLLVAKVLKRLKQV